MTNRIKMLLFSCVCLFIGCVIYIVTRPNAYISRYMLRFINITAIEKAYPLTISFYVPDFLWASALCSGLFAVYPLSANKSWIWGIIAFSCGLIWEMLQRVSVVSGTADVIDVLLYLAAAITVVMINIYYEKRKEK